MLPLDPEPTVEQMVEACVKHTFTENTVAQLVAKGIAEGVSGAFAIVPAKDNQSCFNCGNFGHFLKDCPKRLSLENEKAPCKPQQMVFVGSQEMASRAWDGPT